MKKDSTSRVIAYYHGRSLIESDFIWHVMQARAKFKSDLVPSSAAENQYKVLNLCEDRYHFIVLFAAAMLERVITVMPSNQSPGELERLQQSNPGILKFSDEDIISICQTQQDQVGHLFGGEYLLDIPRQQLVAELYTSGSTGLPSANPKRWGELIHGAMRVADKFKLNRDGQHTIVATVPPQHMFGFEMSVVLPLVAGVAVFHDKPFFPEDIQSALRAVPDKRILITTPLHLKACASKNDGWSEMDFILSSTAALPKETADAASASMQTRVREIYGCSEIGAIATRCVAENTSWELLGDFELELDGDWTYLKSCILEQPLQLSDKIEFESDGRFILAGRAADMLKIGGKRGSLSEITQRIKAVRGVIDAVVFLPSENIHKRDRLVALVVAKGVSVPEIKTHLSQHLDVVFMPRQIFLVEKLPYNTTGKLPHADLQAMLEANIKRGHAC